MAMTNNHILTEALLEIRFNDRFYNQAMYHDDRCNVLYVAYWDACLCFTFGTQAIVIE
jgi:hypothetical protein